MLDPTHKRLVSRRTKYVFRNKNSGHCRTPQNGRKLRCFTKPRCIQRHSFNRNECGKYLVYEYCIFQYTTTCKFCSKSFVRRCYRIKDGHEFVRECSNSKRTTRCTRKVSERLNKKVLMGKHFSTNEY